MYEIDSIALDRNEEEPIKMPQDQLVNDVVQKIEARIDEVCLDVEIKTVHQGDPWSPYTVVDTGSGRSYLICPANLLSHLPLRPLPASFVVELADGRAMNSVTKFLPCTLTIKATDSDEQFTHSIDLLVMPLDALKAPRFQVLLGRDAIHLFRITLDGVSRAFIGNTLIYERGDIETTQICDTHNDIQDLIQLLHIPLTQAIPTDLLKDLENTLSPEDDDVEFELTSESTTIPSRPCQPLSNSSRPNLDISLVADGSSPIARAYIRVPFIDHRRPTLNLRVTAARDRQTIQRLNSEQLRLYLTSIDQLIDGGFAEVIPIDNPNTGHFIPIRPVFKLDRKSTKCRLCLDSRELNKLTSNGNPSGPKISDCLILFRSAPYVGTFDLTKAFWQVKLHPDEQQWFSTIVNGRRLRFTRMIFGGNFSPAGLERSLRLVMDKGDVKSDATPYVDDFLTRSFQSLPILQQQQQALCKVLNDHGFPSDKHCFSTNPESAPEEWTTYLSYDWNQRMDIIRLKKYLVDNPDYERITRRIVVSSIMGLYDPCGMHLRTQLAGRMIIREAFNDKSRDDGSNPWKISIAPTLAERLREWIQFASKPSPPFARFIDCSELFVFADASSTCWVVEFRGTSLELLASRGGLIKTNFTVPRAELVAAYQGLTGVLALPLERMKTTNIILLSDNEAVVHRLRNTKLDQHLPSFERKRIQSMRSLIQGSPVPIRIQHIPGEVNPADYATRPWPLPTKSRPDLPHGEIMAWIQGPEAYYYDGKETTIESEYTHEITLDIDRVKLVTLRSQARVARASGIVPVEIEEEPDEHQGVVEDVEDMEEIETAANRRARLVEAIRLNQLGLDDANLDRNNDGLLIARPNRIILNPSNAALIRELVLDIHNQAHGGVNATVAIVKREFQWKRLRRDVRNIVAECPTCSVARAQRATRTAVGDCEWLTAIDDLGVCGVVGVDVCEVGSSLGPVNEFLTVTCALTKYIRTSTITSQQAADVVDALSIVFHQSCFPRVIVTDAAPSFRSKRFKLFCLQHRMIHLLSPAYSPSYHGWYERPHKSILDQLRLLVLDFPSKQWTLLLPEATYLTNCRPYTETDVLAPIHLMHVGAFIVSSPFHQLPDEALMEKLNLLHLFQPPAERLVQLGERLRNRHQRRLHDYLEVFKAKRQAIRRRLQTSVKQQRDFAIGDMVRVYRPPASKIAPGWSMPRKIVGAPSKGTRYVLREDGKTSLEYIANLSAA